MRDELISITRMLMGMPPAIAGDLPAPDAEAGAKAGDGAKDKKKSGKGKKTKAENSGKAEAKDAAAT